MAENAKITMGVIFLVLLTSGAIVGYENVKNRLDDDRGTLYISGRVQAREYHRLMDGSSTMNRDVSGINTSATYDLDRNTTTLRRVTPYQRGPVLVHTRIYHGNITDVRHFPRECYVEAYNASGHFFRYTVDELPEIADKRKFLNGETSATYPNNVTVQWDDGYRWAWQGYPYGNDSLTVQYGIRSDYERFDVCAFDPPQEVVDGGREIKYINECKNVTTSYMVNRNITKEHTCRPGNVSCTESTYTIIVSEMRKNVAEVCDEVGVVVDGKRHLYNTKDVACLRTGSILCCWDKDEGGTNLEGRSEYWRTRIQRGKNGGEFGSCSNISKSKNSLEFEGRSNLRK